jgi:Zn-dependent peptidase ImmA (M78 family)/transcriptional regulator with XRE-family HTH domain
VALKAMKQTDETGMPVTPAIVTWARERAGYSLEEAQKEFRSIASWERAGSKPSYPQLERMADKFKCPVAAFFFPEPPSLPPINETFRTLPESQLGKIPREIKLLLRKAKAMQIGLADLSDGRNPASRLITRDLRFENDISPTGMAGVVREYLGVTVEMQSRWDSVEDALEKWRGLIADAGVFIFKDAFRQPDYFGFCLEDDEFPIIYVNNTAAKTRQIFTIVHELGHLLFHTSGIYVSDDAYIDELPDLEKRIEVTCNRFAADMLVPPNDFERRSAALPADRNSAEQLANLYKVSREVVYRRFLDLNRIERVEYIEASRVWRDEMRREKGGGDYYNNQMAYLGRRYIGLALQRFYQRRIDQFELAEYLNVKPTSIAGIEERYTRGERRQ